MLDQYKQKVLELLERLKESSIPSDRNEVFVALETLQREVMRKVMNGELAQDSFLTSFLRDFDRLDSDEVRKKIVENLKSGRYINLTA